MTKKRETSKKINRQLSKVSKLNRVLSLPHIMPQDIDSLSEDEKIKLYDVASRELTEASGGKNFEAVALKYYHAMPQDAKNQIWDINHLRIIHAIKKSLRESGVFPTKTLIASITGLSRNTIQKHLDHYASSDQKKYAEASRYLINESLMSTLLFFAYQGNTKAARLYMEAAGMIQQPRQYEGQSQNYIQVNGITINQTLINQLSPERLSTIEAIIKQLQQDANLT